MVLDKRVLLRASPWFGATPSGLSKWLQYGSAEPSSWANSTGFLLVRRSVVKGETDERN